jgi:ribosomal protein S18 acetylase RimI-like enzyme
MSTLIRQARPDDLAAVVALTEQWASEPTTTGHYPFNSVDFLRQRLGPYFLVAQEEPLPTVVGFLVTYVATHADMDMSNQVAQEGETYLSLSQLYVHPAHRKRGIGSLLVAGMRSTAQAQGISNIVLLSINLDWPGTISFYERQGFRRWYFTMFTGSSTEERRRDSTG